MANNKWQDTNPLSVYRNFIANASSTKATSSNASKNLANSLASYKLIADNQSAQPIVSAQQAAANLVGVNNGNSNNGASVTPVGLVGKTNLTFMNGNTSTNNEGVIGDTKLNNSTFTNYNPNNLTSHFGKDLQTNSLNNYVDIANNTTDTTDNAVVDTSDTVLTGLEKEQADTNAYYDKQVEALLSQYQMARDELEKEKRLSQQGASITLDKLQKYLPTQVKAQGLGGLGVSETSALQAYNNYANNMGSIENSYQTNLNDIESNKNSSTMELENYRREALKANKTEAEAAELQNLSYAQAVIDQSPATSLDEMLKYIEGYKGSMSDENYQKLVDFATVKTESNLNALKTADLDKAGDAILTTIKENPNGLAYSELIDYLEQNKDTLGEATYKAKYDQLQKAGRAELDMVLAEYDTNNDPKGALGYLEKNRNVFSDAEEYQKLYDKYFDVAYPYVPTATEIESVESGVTTYTYGGKNYRVGDAMAMGALTRQNNAKIIDNALDKSGYDSIRDSRIPNGFTASDGESKAFAYFNGRWYKVTQI